MTMQRKNDYATKWQLKTMTTGTNTTVIRWLRMCCIFSHLVPQSLLHNLWKKYSKNFKNNAFVFFAHLSTLKAVSAVYEQVKIFRRNWRIFYPPNKNTSRQAARRSPCFTAAPFCDYLIVSHIIKIDSYSINKFCLFWYFSVVFASHKASCCGKFRFIQCLYADSPSTSIVFRESLSLMGFSSSKSALVD